MTAVQGVQHVVHSGAAERAGCDAEGGGGPCCWAQACLPQDCGRAVCGSTTRLGHAHALMLLLPSRSTSR